MELDIRDGQVFVQADPERSMALTDVAARMDGDAHQPRRVTIEVPGSADYIVNSFGGPLCRGGGGHRHRPGAGSALRGRPRTPGA